MNRSRNDIRRPAFLTNSPLARLALEVFSQGASELRLVHFAAVGEFLTAGDLRQLSLGQAFELLFVEATGVIAVDVGAGGLGGFSVRHELGTG